MGWFEIKNNTYRPVEPNCYFRLPYEDATNQYNRVQRTEFGRQQVYKVLGNYIYLSLTMEWVFRNLDASFKEPCPKSLPSL